METSKKQTIINPAASAKNSKVTSKDSKPLGNINSKSATNLEKNKEDISTKKNTKVESI